VVEKDFEFLGGGFLLVFISNCKPTMHRLTTVHGRDQPTRTIA